MCIVNFAVVWFNINIFITFALDENVIFDMLHFPMRDIYQSRDLGRANGRISVNDSQLRCLLTFA